MTDVDTLLESVERSRAALLNSTADISDDQAAFRPGEGRWSIVECLEHLYLAEVSGVSKIWAAVTALRAGRAWIEDRPNRGRTIEDVVATTWKPKEIAPPIATPHIGGPITFWISATQSLQPVLVALGSQLHDANLEDVVFPHYLSGPLDARQRLEFLRFHIERHANQIARIRATPGFPS